MTTIDLSKKDNKDLPPPVNTHPRDKRLGLDPRRVLISDSTLRQGDYSETCQMEPEEKLAVAGRLAKLGVDIVEVGEPFTSKAIFEQCQQIAETVGTSHNSPIIMALCKADKQHIKVAYEAIQAAEYPRLHLIAPADELYRCLAPSFATEQQEAEGEASDSDSDSAIDLTEDGEESDGESCSVNKVQEYLDQMAEAVEYGREICPDIQFSVQDAFRLAQEESGRWFLLALLGAAVRAGAATVTLSDTFGYCTPSDVTALLGDVRRLCREVALAGGGGAPARVGLACHDDLGLSVANYLAGVQAGARQLQCTVNGIGRRAGNAPLEEVAVALKVRRDYYRRFFVAPEGEGGEDLQQLTAVRAEELYPTSQLVAKLTGLKVQRNKAVVGENAFYQRHLDNYDGKGDGGVMYQILRPEEVGAAKSDKLVLGKSSGRTAFVSHLTGAMGLDAKLLRDEQIDNAFRRFKELCDLKKDVTPLELEALVNDELYRVSGAKQRYDWGGLQVYLGTAGRPTATLTLFDRQLKRDVERTVVAETGITAALTALEQVLQLPAIKLMDFSILSKGAAAESVGEAVLHVKCLETGKVFYGRGSSSDIVLASAQGYLNALNRIYGHRNQVTQSLIDLQLSGTRVRKY